MNLSHSSGTQDPTGKGDSLVGVRLLLLSDLHLEMHPYTPAREGYDVVVLAGDIHTKGRGVAWAKNHFRVPVLYVLGNHEGYGGHWEKTVDKMRTEAEGSQVHILHRDEKVIQGVRFLGVTGWSGFELWPERRDAMYLAGMGRDPNQAGMRDYRFIRTGGYRRIQPHDTVRWNQQDKQWLSQSVQKPFDGPTVIVMHHAPSVKSLENGVQEPLDAADANPWDDLIAKSGAALCCHGHTHHPVDYFLGNTQVISNPRGYPGQQLAHRTQGIWTVRAGADMGSHGSSVAEDKRLQPGRGP